MTIIRKITKEMIIERASAMADKYIEKNPMPNSYERKPLDFLFRQRRIPVILQMRKERIVKSLREKGLLELLTDIGFDLEKNFWKLNGERGKWGLICGVRNERRKRQNP